MTYNRGMPNDEPVLNQRSVSPLELVMAGARVFTLVAGIVLILVGAVYAVQVFWSVGSLLKNPAGLEGPVKTVEKLISAENLAVPVNGQPVQFGGAIAMCLLLLWYLFWAWIPLALIAAGGRLVAACSQLREGPSRPATR
jgi:hypothetical protein